MSLLPLCDQRGECRPARLEPRLSLGGESHTMAAGEKPALQVCRALRACHIPSFREMQALQTQGLTSESEIPNGEMPKPSNAGDGLVQC